MTEQRELITKRVMDANEPGVIRYELYKYGWEQNRLLVADYWFFAHNYKKVGIERKTIDDLLGSMGDKLSRQLENTLEHYDISILLIEGSWKKVSTQDKLISSRGITYHTWDMVWNYLERFMDKGFRLQLTINEGHTIHRLNELYALYQKPYSLSGRSREFTDDRVLALPSGCRGKSGMEVLKAFGSLRAVGNAGRDELVCIEGVGKKRAELIFNHFNRDNVK